jgi:hypothetical protein
MIKLVPEMHSVGASMLAKSNWIKMMNSIMPLMSVEKSGRFCEKLPTTATACQKLKN